MYSRNFGQHLTDHGARPVYCSLDSTNLESNLAKLSQPRQSLSPAQFTESTFKAFQRENAQAKDEADVEANIIPTLLGCNRARHLAGRNTIFGNLEPLTDGTIAPAKPDIYNGSSPANLCSAVRDQLGHHIIPSSMHDKPIVPNYFIETKGPNGSFAVATQQVRYAGALGSRAMHTLKSYAEEEEVYTSNAYTFSSIYHGGTLTMFTHHLAGPNERGADDYHMTQVGAWAVTGDRDSFVRGAGALRNAQDIAKHYRDEFIQAANNKALSDAADTRFANDLSTSRKSMSLAEACICPGDERYPALGISGSGDAAGYPTSGAKRRRSHGSPSSGVSNRSPPSKLRRPLDTQGQDSLSTPTTDHIWVDTYWQEGYICFRIGVEVTRTNPYDWTLETREDGRFCFRLVRPQRHLVRTEGVKVEGISAED